MMNRKLLGLGLAGVLAITVCGADTSRCHKVWNKHYKKLSEEELGWVMQGRESEWAGADIDGDGTLDEIVMDSKRWIRDCTPEDDWMLKYNTLLVRLSGGGSQLYDWKGGLLEKYTIDPNKKTITTDEVFIDGSRGSRVMYYGNGNV